MDANLVEKWKLAALPLAATSSRPKSDSTNLSFLRLPSLSICSISFRSGFHLHSSILNFHKASSSNDMASSRPSIASIASGSPKKPWSPKKHQRPSCKLWNGHENLPMICTLQTIDLQWIEAPPEGPETQDCYNVQRQFVESQSLMMVHTQWLMKSIFELSFSNHLQPEIKP
jgi:hypothetical protein